MTKKRNGKPAENGKKKIELPRLQIAHKTADLLVKSTSANKLPLDFPQNVEKLVASLATRSVWSELCLSSKLSIEIYQEGLKELFPTDTK